jgi:hypothetical protein
MRRWNVGLVLVIAAAGCTARGHQQPRTLLEQGRLYTAWLYGSEYQKLWNRFSPEMRQTFGSVGDLASFAGRAVTRLGQEKSAIDERMSTEAPFHIYQRTASFNHSRHRMLIEWSLAKNGEVTGLVLRPVPGDSL